MEKKETLQTEKYVREALSGEGSGHDWWHIHRVRQNALNIAETEGGDREIIELTALLHDIADSKNHDGDHSVGPKVARKWLESIDVSEEKIKHICTIIEKQSFSAKSSLMETIEGQIVQDADRLEAIGAIGIARCFAYGGNKNRLIYDPSGEDQSTSVQHFYDKLLKVKDLMNTETAKSIAEKRHKFIEAYLEQFYAEWEGKR